jgi:hypothetical protein
MPLSLHRNKPTSNFRPKGFFASNSPSSICEFSTEIDFARHAGRVIVNTALDHPWSQYFCCMLVGSREFVRKNPVATKHVVRAILKATDFTPVVRSMRNQGGRDPNWGNGAWETGRLHPLNAAKAERAKTVPLALVQHAFKPGQWAIPEAAPHLCRMSAACPRSLPGCNPSIDRTYGISGRTRRSHGR